MPHYFQRYAQRENWVTNATLHLLSRLSHFDRRYFERAINLILDHEHAQISTEITFDQQKGGAESANIIDGLIKQQSFAIAIETKLGNNQDVAQLIRHLASLTGDEEMKVLLALSQNDTPADVITRVQSEATRAAAAKGNIFVASTTYQKIIDAIQTQLSDRDAEMLEILEDYVALCQEHGLLDVSKRTMLTVPVGTSKDINLAQRIYYCPASRNQNRPYSHIGFYNSKHLIAAGRLELKVAVDLVDGELQYPEGKPHGITPEQEARIRTTIEGTDYYNLRQWIRFFLLDDFMDDLAVPVPRVIQGIKYFTFGEAIDLTAPDAVEKLRSGVAEHYAVG